MIPSSGPRASRDAPGPRVTTPRGRLTTVPRDPFKGSTFVDEFLPLPHVRKLACVCDQRPDCERTRWPPARGRRRHPKGPPAPHSGAPSNQSGRRGQSPKGPGRPEVDRRCEVANEGRTFAGRRRGPSSLQFGRGRCRLDPGISAVRDRGGRVPRVRANFQGILRKEVIQPQVPLRLPCYDLVPITGFIFGACLAAPATSDAPRFGGLTGGVYKAQEHIHRGMLIRDY